MPEQGAKVSNPFFDTGVGDMNLLFDPEGTYLLAYLRIHFENGSGSAPVYVNERARQGEEYGVRLIAIMDRGVGADVNLIFHSNESRSPSGWQFDRGDAIRIVWTDPDPNKATRWGVKLGVAAP